MARASISFPTAIMPVIVAVALTVVRLVLAYQTPVTVLLGSGTAADDRLFASAAL